MKLWRGLMYGPVTSGELASLRNNEGYISRFLQEGSRRGFGIHWTDDPVSAENFALDRDPEGWVREPIGPDNFDDEEDILLGVVVEAEVDDKDVVEVGSDEYEDLSFSDMILDYGVEREVTVRPGSRIDITEVNLIWQEEDGHVGFDRLDVNMRGITANYAPLEHKFAQDSGRLGMIAIYPPSDLASELAIDDKNAEDPEELHITVVFLGCDVPDDVANALPALLEKFTSTYNPTSFEVALNGWGVFENEESVFWLAVDSPDLNDLRENLLDMLETIDYEPPNDHGFTPHMTLKYLEEDEPAPSHLIEKGVTFNVDTISLVFGDDRRDFKLGAES